MSEKVFIQASFKESNRGSPVGIKCFIEDYTDLEKVLQSATELRKRVHFPGVFYMKTRILNETDGNPFIVRYLHCNDGDLYERMYGRQTGFGLLKRNSSKR